MAVEPLRIRVGVEGADEAKDKLRGVGESVEQVGDKAERAGGGGFATLAKSLGVLATIGAAIKFTNLYREMDAAEAKLLAFTGTSDRARQALDMIARLPGELGANVAAFVGALSSGIDASEQRMRGYITFSRAFGVDLEKVVDDMGKAASGKFDALEKYGVRVRESGAQLVVSFQGQTQTIARESSALQDYLADIASKNEAVLKAASDNTGPVKTAWEDLKLAAFDLANTIGLLDGAGGIIGTVKGLLADVIGIATSAINKVNELLSLGRSTPRDEWAYGQDVGNLQARLQPVFDQHGSNPDAWPEDIWSQHITDVTELNGLLEQQAQYMAAGGDAEIGRAHV